MKAHSDLTHFLASYNIEIQELFWELRNLILSFDDKANELIWDNYNALAVAYSRSKKLKDAYCHVALYSKHLNLGFNRGAELSKNIVKLEGSGKLIRHIRITHKDTIDKKPFLNLLDEACNIAFSRNPSLIEINSIPKSLVMSISQKKLRPRK